MNGATSMRLSRAQAAGSNRPLRTRLAAVRPDEPAATTSRRDAGALLAGALLAGLAVSGDAQAIGDGNPLNFKKTVNNRRRKIPESEYLDGPQGLK
jgi:hypothetical protein